MENNTTHKKITLLREIEYSNDFDFVSNVLLQWSKQKTTKTLDELIAATNRMYFFTFNMQEEVRLMRLACDQYRTDKLRAVERARISDQENEKLLSKLKNFNYGKI